MAGSADEAEDVLQETFLQAYLKLDTFRGGSRFYTWLYRIAINQFVSRRRRERPTMSLDRGPDVDGVDPADPGERPEGRMLREERAGVVVGIAGSLMISRSLGALKYGIRSADPVTLTVTSVALVLVAVVASVIPARRATRVDPIEALRAE